MDGTDIETPVLIVGGGPVGLMLAIELAWRGVGCVLVNDGETTSTHPQGSGNNSRTMEHYRPLGLAERVRATGLAPQDTTDVAYVTRSGGFELARLEMPSSAEKMRRMAAHDPGLPSPEIVHRGNQFYIEPILQAHAEAIDGPHLLFGWRMEAFEQGPDGVDPGLHAPVRPSPVKFREGKDAGAGHPEGLCLLRHVPELYRQGGRGLGPA